MVRSLYVIAVTLIISLLATQQAGAASPPDVFAIRDVIALRENMPLEDAKSEALYEAKNQAMVQLIKRLTPFNYHWKVDMLEAKLAAGAIKSFRPHDERMTSFSYNSLLDVEFDQDKVKMVLNRLGSPYSTKYSPPALIIPILYHSEDDIELWGNGKWSTIWNNQPEIVGLSQFLYAFGELDDMLYLDPKVVFTRPYDYFKPLLNKYNCLNAVLLFARQSQFNLDISLRFLGPHYDYLRYHNYKITNRDPASDYQRIIENLLLKIDAKWKGEDLFEIKKIFSSYFVVQVTSLKDWTNIKKTLEGKADITEVQVEKFNQDRVDARVSHFTDPSLLIQSLEEDGFNLYKDDGRFYIVSLNKDEVKEAISNHLNPPGITSE
jgi:hypothetical protein